MCSSYTVRATMNYRLQFLDMNFRLPSLPQSYPLLGTSFVACPSLLGQEHPAMLLTPSALAPVFPWRGTCSSDRIALISSCSRLPRTGPSAAREVIGSTCCLLRLLPWARQRRSPGLFFLNLTWYFADTKSSSQLNGDVMSVTLAGYGLMTIRYGLIVQMIVVC